jgi:hypothetical protein
MMPAVAEPFHPFAPARRRHAPVELFLLLLRRPPAVRNMCVHALHPAGYFHARAELVTVL